MESFQDPETPQICKIHLSLLSAKWREEATMSSLSQTKASTLSLCFEFRKLLLLEPRKKHDTSAALLLPDHQTRIFAFQSIFDSCKSDRP
jgi:hypothetical protein